MLCKVLLIILSPHKNHTIQSQTQSWEPKYARVANVFKGFSHMETVAAVYCWSDGMEAKWVVKGSTLVVVSW